MKTTMRHRNNCTRAIYPKSDLTCECGTPLRVIKDAIKHASDKRVLASVAGRLYDSAVIDENEHLAAVLDVRLNRVRTVIVDTEEGMFRAAIRNGKRADANLDNLVLLGGTPAIRRSL